jgi:hypothetical protein
MAKFINSKLLGRKIRWDDDVSELGKSTYKLTEQLIKSGKAEEALELLEYEQAEWINLHDAIIEFAAAELTFVVENFGEAHIDKLWRHVGKRTVEFLFANLDSQTPEEMVALYTELQRAHGAGSERLGEFSVVEGPDRFVMSFDPCGSGGRLRKMGKAGGLTVKSYPWSWSKTGVPYYCAHCCLFFELMPAETLGYPIRIHENVDSPDKPCVQIVYKDPALIPEHYFTRIGVERDPSRFHQG